MVRAHRRFAEVFFALGLSLTFGRAAHSQAQSITARNLLTHASIVPGPCNDRRPAPGNRRETKSAHGTAPSGNLCDELTSDHNPASPSWRADVRDKANEDSVLEELKAMGEKGLTIERAREEVVQILEGHNRCAAWFEQAEPDAAKKFRSLHYTIDESSPQYVLKVQNPAGGWLYLQPYVASSMENASAGSTIAINGKGAFFQLRAGLRIVPKDGGPGGLSSAQLLHLDLYVGGTLGAQVVTLLHEFSHVVGLLPADGESASDRELSTQNTQMVLQRCRAQVEAAGKHKGLPLNRLTQ
jgi:hypothetical protein